jgi:hypothetical protein
LGELRRKSFPNVDTDIPHSSPPQHLLEVGKQVNEFFNVSYDQDGRKRYRLKPMDQYATEHQTTEQPSKQYFKATQLPEIIKTYPMPKKITKQSDIDKGRWRQRIDQRIAFSSAYNAIQQK